MEFIYTHAVATNSSTMQAVYWNDKTNELAIHFWAGSVIKYINFYSDDFRAFSNALSKGRFYNSYIKGSFGGTKLEDGTRFIHFDNVVKEEVVEPQLLNADLAPSIQVTVNIYVNGDPEKIAEAVERLAPSVRAVQNWRR